MMQQHWPVHYKIEPVEPGTCSLANNHSHFILVDNGTQHQFGATRDLRFKLENAISMLEYNTCKCDL